MLIGELAARTGLSRDTIRFYEKQGLITVSPRQRRNNNYKEYPQEIVARMLSVIRLKDFGFTLNEIANLLNLLEIDMATCDHVEEVMDQKVVLFNEKIRELTVFRDRLMAGMAKCKAGRIARPNENCPILTSGLP